LDDRNATFRALAAERIERLNLAWLELERNDAEAARTLRRELHTLKGEASISGFQAVADLTHAIEDAVEAIFAAGKPPSDEQGDAILGALDALGELTEDDPDASLPAEVLTSLKSVAGDGAAASEVAAVATAPVEPEYSVIETAQSAEPGERRSERQGASIRIDARQLDEIRQAVGELMLTRSRLQAVAEHLRQRESGRTESTTMSYKEVENELRDEVFRLSALLDTMEGATRSMRMVPVGRLFDRFPRAVRDLSRELGKKIELKVAGHEAEIDREVLTALEEPLLHLLRNAADHGIEPPEQRRSKGKSETGTIWVSAVLTGSQVRVVVADDGGGIDLEGVRAKAISRGLLPANAPPLSVKEAVDCLLEPGMSTRDSVSSISGRGVGLDVVKSVVAEMGGTLEVESGPSGTRFALRAPVSTAISNMVVFQVGHGHYALPCAVVETIARADSFDIVDSMASPALIYEGRSVPLLSLSDILDEEVLINSPVDLRTVIVNAGGELLALRGTRNHQRREAVVKPISSKVSSEGLCSTGFPLEDGSLVLVLNPGPLRDLGATRRRSRSVAPTGRTGHAVLVADDSPVVRELLVDTLRAAGLTVIEATDGAEALALLDEHPEVGLLLTDVEMPRMNGLELISKVRARGGAHLPAVVISTRGSDADKEAAVEVGADNYLVKSDFSRSSLLDLVRRYFQ
jgi:chemotaxis protein histidine kinase CheA